MIDYSLTANTVGAFPIVVAQNASGAGATDGTPYIATFIDDLWGRMQALMDRAPGLFPNGVTESSASSQHIEALRKGFALGAGYTVMYNKVGSPAGNFDRVLLLTGQGILRASFIELDTQVYVGDGNNAAVAAGGGSFYRADDEAGTIPNVVGIFLILPDYRGRVPRGDDIGATVDPLGAARFLGDAQADAFQGHEHNYIEGFNAGPEAANAGFNTQNIIAPTKAIVTDGVNGTPRISSESRMANVQTRYAITY